MDLKLKDPTKVYYCKEQRRSFAGVKVHEDVKVTHHVRQLLNQGVLLEITKPKLSDEDREKLMAEAKVEAKVKAEAEAEAKAEAEAARVAALSPEERSVEVKAAKAAALAKAKEIEKA